MDRAEAIEILEYERDTDVFVSDYRNRVHEAIDLAIEALREPETLWEQGMRSFDGLEKVLVNRGDAEFATTTDCISRADIEYHTQLEARGNGEYEEVEVAYRSDIDNLPPVTPTEQNEEDILKFYYVESLDEYWIGQRCGTRYYGKWTGNCFTFGYSRYLPWGEHVVAPDTLWKEHTYPSEPKEIPFNEWLQGFLEKDCQPERTGEWIVYPLKDEGRVALECPECGYALIRAADRRPHFCENCGAKMGGDE